MDSINAFFAALWADEAGVTAIEYGLLAALIAVVCIGAFTNLSVAVVAMYDLWTNAVVAAMP